MVLAAASPDRYSPADPKTVPLGVRSQRRLARACPRPDPARPPPTLAVCTTPLPPPHTPPPARRPTTSSSSLPPPPRRTTGTRLHLSVADRIELRTRYRFDAGAARWVTLPSFRSSSHLFGERRPKSTHPGGGEALDRTGSARGRAIGTGVTGADPRTARVGPATRAPRSCRPDPTLRRGPPRESLARSG